MKIIKYLILIISITTVISCELFENLEDGLSKEEVIEGLKKALELGTDTATNVLSIVDGYYKDPLVKVPLPPEAENIRNLITNNDLADLLDLENEFENVVQSINRAAEDAAKEAAPIFKSAITDLTISQGWDILNGIVPDTKKSISNEEFDSTAATEYMKIKTYNPLAELYQPKIKTALSKDLGLGFSADEAWTTLVGTYNSVINNVATQIVLALAGVDLPGEINENIEEFTTQKALDGLFYKVGREEKKIRRDPYAWAVDIIQKVFGSVME